jgi:hypothetical protein
VILLGFAVLLANAQGNTPSAESPDLDVTFTAATQTGATEFRIGEAIPLQLSFSSPATKTYQINMASYDRSGRMSYEQFAVRPENGWSDPLKDYFSSFAGYFEGGLTGFQTLSEKPITITLYVNEWVRFDAPGQYRLRVTTNRVGKINRQRASPFANDPQPLTSNELVLTIIPATKEWQEETLRRALDTIDRPVTGAQAAQEQEAQSRQAAIKTVRYLNTVEAAQEMARRFNDDDNAHDYSFGLIGSIQREPALKSMQLLLTDPDYPITADVVSTLSVLSVQSGQPQEVMRKARTEAAAQISAQLWQCVAQKRGSAKAISLVTALSTESSRPPKDGIPLLAESFDQLPLQQQQELLEYRWDLIKSPEMLPVLRKYARQYQDFPMLTEQTAYASIHLSGAALQHWYELEPEEARAAIMDEILRPKPRFNAKTLGILPDESLPGIDQTLVDHLLQSDNFQISANLASLIERYGTKAVLPQVLAIVDSNVGKWACAIQTPAVAFLLRIDPASARSRIEAAMAARGKGFTACNHSLLTEVAQIHFDPMLEEIGTRSLWDEDPEVAENAAAFLGQFGSPAAEDRLWERLEQWSSQWSGREADLKVVIGEASPNISQLGLGHNLAQSLSMGQAWLADPTKLERIAQLSVDSSVREQTQRMIDAWQTNWQVSCLGPPADARCSVLQYRSLTVEKLKDKLAEFPKGSRFTWMDFVQSNALNHDDLYRDLVGFVANQGMALSKAN